ncbi:methyltransferase domain-containing protein [Modestobacter sp. I12A-02628]|uniref:Methyltransferase domain-containing protein n=1 Tax=Goekera deserti TaxID=2497753 RepID=A0A7K3W9V6_9ACTN|nr:methyltransferase domain-containing protein [Goekera deserti]MPQ98820.1 methyltransferase domain-containing protein [Goekera deserti]NDI49681.1 methyltransferase domain-containing protein [Goekera deserti]NEL53126.1 methyltransferase domain-containing protein [Goekera deserti]
MSTQGDAGPGGRAAADFAGETARLYRSHRRDLPADQARSLARELRLRAEDVVVDLGCGTGQLAVPLRRHCAGVVAVDPEPAMLAGLRDRAEPGVLCLLGSDDDLPVLGEWLTADDPLRGVGAALPRLRRDVPAGTSRHRWVDGVT